MDLMMMRRMIMANQGEPVPVFHTYLKFDGTAWIDTGYLLPDDCVISLTGYAPGYTSSRQILGCTDGTYKTGIQNGSSSGVVRSTWYYNGANGARNGGTLGSPYSLFLTPTRGGGYTETRATFTKSTNKPNATLKIGTIETGSVTRCNTKMSYVYIYGDDAKDITAGSQLENYTPIATFRPCTYGGRAGMWWVEQDVFLGNSAGAGTLTCED